MKNLLAEIRQADGTLVTSGDVYITIINATDTSNPITVLGRTKTGVSHIGSGVWGYTNPYEDPGNKTYIVVFDYVEDEDYTHVVTGAITMDDSQGNWAIIGAAGVKVGNIKTKTSKHMEINLSSGRKLNLRRI